MPLELRVTHQGQTTRLPDVVAGGPPASITNQVPGDEHLLVVVCGNQDDGGLVLRQELDATLAADRAHRLLAAEGEPLVDIPRGGSCELQVQVAGQVASLAIRHAVVGLAAPGSGSRPPGPHY